MPDGDYLDEPKRPFPASGARMAYDLASQRVSIQIDQIDAVDSKLAQFLTLASALTAIGLAVLALRTADGSQASVPGLGWVFMMVALGFWAVIAIWAVYAYWIQSWGYGPKLRETWGHLRDGYADEQMLWWAAEVFTKAYYENEEAMQPKLHAAKWVAVLTMWEFVSLTIGLLVVLIDA